MSLLEQKQVDSLPVSPYMVAVRICRTYLEGSWYEVYLSPIPLKSLSMLIYRKPKRGWLPIFRERGDYKLYLSVTMETFTDIMLREYLIKRWTWSLTTKGSWLRLLFTQLTTELERVHSGSTLDQRKSELENYLINTLHSIRV